MAQPRTTLRVALAQLDLTVGDIAGNASSIKDAISSARDAGAHLVLTPELAVTGYPAEDLWLKPHFLAAAEEALREIAAGVEGIVAVVGFAQRDLAVHNALAVLEAGEVKGTYRKILLPNYGVFDERRYFEAGDSPAMIELNGVRIGLTICEDIWFPGPPASTEALAGAALIVNPSASPYHRGKGAVRERMVADRARETGVAFAVCNLVGGQDELVFDGHSVIVSERAKTIARAPQFQEDLLICDIDLPTRPRSDTEVSLEEELGLDVLPTGAGIPLLARIRLPEASGAAECEIARPLDPDAEVYEALKVGLADYVRKNGFERVLVALSGG